MKRQKDNNEFHDPPEIKLDSFMRQVEDGIQSILDQLATLQYKVLEIEALISTERRLPNEEVGSRPMKVDPMRAADD